MQENCRISATWLLDGRSKLLSQTNHEWDFEAEPMSDLTLVTFSLLSSGRKKCYHQQSNLSSLRLWHITRSEWQQHKRVSAGLNVTAEYYGKFLKKMLCQNIHSSRPELFTASALFLHNSMRQHTAAVLPDLLCKYGCKVPLFLLYIWHGLSKLWFVSKTKGPHWEKCFCSLEEASSGMICIIIHVKEVC
jgi:hypothetical protein